MADGDRTLTARVVLHINGNYSLEKDLGGNILGPYSVRDDLAFTSGAGDLMSDRQYRDAGSVSTSGTSFDLTGTLTDAYGQTITLTDISCIRIKNTTAAGGGNLIVGAGTNPWIPWIGGATQTIVIPPQFTFALFGPTDGQLAVTAGTGDVLKLAASSGTVSYELYFQGRST